jgi:hypothetical protein
VVDEEEEEEEGVVRIKGWLLGWYQARRQGVVT